MSDKIVRTRFAPSPSGHLHVGGARTALFNYLYAKACGGKFILRVEDTDQARSTPESEQLILDSLQWLGITADEGPREGGNFGPYRQSDRLGVYEKYTQRLVEQKLAYPCFCNDEELSAKQLRSKQMGVPHVYDGKCRALLPDEVAAKQAAGERFAIRFRIEPGEIAVEDLVQGRVKFDSRLIGDFIIVKSDGFPSYNYAVVIDDSEMQITHVIRGVGHLSNTPRQILIHTALGLPLPAYAHISEIVGTDRKKLSKRRGATSVLFFRDLGYLSEAFVNYMALLGWYPEDAEEYMRRGDLARKFDIARCSKSPAMFDFFQPEKGGEDFDPQAISRADLQKVINNKSKLNFLNNRFIRDLPVAEVWQEVLPFLKESPLLQSRLKTDEDQLKRSFDAVRVYLDNLDQARAYLEEIFRESETLQADAAEELRKEGAASAVEAFRAAVAKSQPGTPEEFSAAMKEAGQNSGTKGRGLFMPIRAAATGTTQGLELPSLFSILGPAEVTRRLDSALKQL